MLMVHLVDVVLLMVHKYIALNNRGEEILPSPAVHCTFWNFTALLLDRFSGWGKGCWGDLD
jgi:hypothetical protein